MQGRSPIVIDPGQAFGTGAHATTRLCIELLLGVEPSGLVDLGCGSGVVAMAAPSSGSRPCSPSTTTSSPSRQRA